MKLLVDLRFHALEKQANRSAEFEQNCGDVPNPSTRGLNRVNRQEKTSKQVIETYAKAPMPYGLWHP